ncbi:hypothetical protein EV126DRAFT_170650 [Verticillium dahliae]|nr:hypothetical protein EV126DRAFT_170650 [Verticillium dahliae]
MYVCGLYGWSGVTVGSRDRLARRLSVVNEMSKLHDWAASCSLLPDAGPLLVRTCGWCHCGVCVCVCVCVCVVCVWCLLSAYRGPFIGGRRSIHRILPYLRYASWAAGHTHGMTCQDGGGGGVLGGGKEDEEGARRYEQLLGETKARDYTIINGEERAWILDGGHICLVLKSKTSAFTSDASR